MIQNIQYIFHSLLQSKYKTILNIIIYTFIYLSINNVQIASCMMEGDEIPQIGEAKAEERPVNYTTFKALIQENVNLTNTINELHAESQAKRAGDATYIEELEEYIDCINERYSDRISRFDHQLMELVVHENPRNVPFLRKLEIENQVLRQDQIRILESQSRALGEAISAAKDADDLQKQVKSLRYENLELKNKIDELQRRLQETLRK